MKIVHEVQTGPKYSVVKYNEIQRYKST